MYNFMIKVFQFSKKVQIPNNNTLVMKYSQLLKYFTPLVCCIYIKRHSSYL